MKYHIEFDLDFRRNPYPGKFIVIEGIDAAGKTTHVNDLAKILKDEKLFITKNPTDGEIGKFIRRVLSGKTNIPPASFQHLFSADKIDHEEQILRHLKKGETVVSDRYIWSAVAYGMADVDEISDNQGNRLLVANSILSHFYQLIFPDLTIYLDIPVEVAIKRLSKMSKAKEIYEREEKLAQIKKAYEWLIRKFPAEIRIVDANRALDQVSKDVLALVNSLKK